MSDDREHSGEDRPGNPELLTAALNDIPASAYEQLRRRQKRIERISLAAAIVFVVGVVAVVVMSDSDILRETRGALRIFGGGLAPRDYGLNCVDPRNKQTRYCQDRMGEIESDWRSVVRWPDGKANPFTMHEPGDSVKRR